MPNDTHIDEIFNVYGALESKVENALINFIERVSKGETTSEKETEVLPEVVNALADLIKHI